MTAKSATKPNDTITVSIESLGGLGDGVATYQDRAIFIAKTCKNEQVEAVITHQTAQRQTARLTRVIQPSPDRVKAPCKHYDHCGGCSLQHLSQTSYQSFKRDVMARAVQAAGFPLPDTADIVFLPANTRRRVRFAIKKQEGKRLLALHEASSHELTPIDKCPILKDTLQAQLPQIQAALQNIHESVNIVAVSLTDTPQGTDVTLVVAKEYSRKVFASCEPLKEHAVARINISWDNQQSSCIYEWKSPAVMIDGHHMPFPAHAFLQVSDEGQAALTRYVLEATKQSRHVLDLFCGLGTYSLPISEHASVFAVDSDDEVIQCLSNETVGNANIRVMQRDLFKNPLQPDDMLEYGAIILNPPRAGAHAQIKTVAKVACPKVIMVSCNPASFSRDAKILNQSGYKLVNIQGVDQFVYSTHLELCATFIK